VLVFNVQVQRYFATVLLVAVEVRAAYFALDFAGRPPLLFLARLLGGSVFAPIILKEGDVSVAGLVLSDNFLDLQDYKLV
jgi:hypothetical protein